MAAAFRVSCRGVAQLLGEPGQIVKQMHQIMDTKDPKERERLMQENMQTMKDNMQMMQMTHSKMGQGKMGGDAKGGKMESMKSM